MTYHDNIRIRREELGLSQQDLADLLGYKSRSTISKIESGENDISQSKLKSLAAALQTTPSALMGYGGPGEAQDSPDKKTQKTKPVVYGAVSRDRTVRINQNELPREPHIPETIAAHLDGAELSEDDVLDIAEYIELVKRRKQR